MKIPYLDLGLLNSQYQHEIEEAALQTLRSGYYLNDNKVGSFESKWANYTKSTYCVSTANGLDALTAILVAMKTLYGWKNGSQVIVSAHTFIASFEAITRAGLQVVPCDVSEEDYLIDPQLIEPLITPDTVAIMPVHLYGKCCNMTKIRDIATQYKLKVVVDSCQMHGIPQGQESQYPFGDAAAFSFYPGKNLGALGDAGCLVTDNEALATLARAYCNYGAQQKYHHTLKGVNSRMDSLQAAILSAKLEHLNDENLKRQQQAERYNKGITNPLIRLPYNGKNACNSLWHIYPIFCDNRQALQDYLAAKGITTIVHYPIPPHKQKAYSELNNLSLPVTENTCNTEISLPLNSTLTQQQQDYIIQVLNDFRQ